MASALANPGPVDAYLETELEAWQTTGRQLADNCMVSEEDGRGVVVSRFGMIPKRGQPNQWRLILDLSLPCFKVIIVSHFSKRYQTDNIQ